MVVFNNAFLENWKLSGFRYILVLPFDKYGVLRPLIDDKNVKRGYTLEMSEAKLLQIADDYFFTMEKDVYKAADINRGQK
jgi:hypothetical protein